MNMYDFTLISPHSEGALHPEGRYSHCMVYQYADSVLYNSYDVLSDNETFGDNSLFIHGGLYEGSIADQ